MAKRDTLCWRCKRAAAAREAQCSWARSFIPVAGWTAREGTTSDSYKPFATYCVVDCPLFVNDGKVHMYRNKIGIDAEKAMDLWKKGYNDLEISRATGASQSCVNKWRRKAGLESNYRREAVR